MNYSSLTEKEIMTDLLMSEKQVASTSSIGLTESTSLDLRNILINCLNNTQKCQYEIYLAMNQRGWYQVKEADTLDIKSAQEKYSSLLNKLS